MKEWHILISSVPRVCVQTCIVFAHGWLLTQPCRGAPSNAVTSDIDCDIAGEHGFGLCRVRVGVTSKRVDCVFEEIKWSFSHFCCSNTSMTDAVFSMLKYV